MKESFTFEVWVVLRDSFEYHEGKKFNADENRLFHFFFCKTDIMNSLFDSTTISFKKFAAKRIPK